MKYHFRHRRNLKIILLIALSLSCLGFLLDLNELNPKLLYNVIDISVMSGLLFASGCLIYIMAIIIVYLIPKEI